MTSDSPDIAIIGGGNAALCAAITAAEAGARVLILETAPKPYRGGNSRHTRNFRCMHHGPLGPLVDSYTEEEYLADLMKVTGGKTDEGLARLAIRSSEVKCRPMHKKPIAHQIKQACLPHKVETACFRHFPAQPRKSVTH